MRLRDHTKKKPTPRKPMIPCGFELRQMVIEAIPGQECPFAIWLQLSKVDPRKLLWGSYLDLMRWSNMLIWEGETLVLRPSMARKQDLTSVAARQNLKNALPPKNRNTDFFRNSERQCWGERWFSDPTPVPQGRKANRGHSWKTKNATNLSVDLWSEDAKVIQGKNNLTQTKMKKYLGGL